MPLILSFDQLIRLWGEYRDEEHTLYFTDEEWEEYKKLFKRGPNFPDFAKKSIKEEWNQDDTKTP